MKAVLAFGNPLLDVTVTSKDHVAALIKKYNLKVDGQKEISREEMALLSKDIEGLDQHISPGGCCQNSLRVLQWVLRKKGQVAIFGSVGQDREADVLRNALELDGVQARYIIHETLPTGKTVALVTGPTRSLIAHIGAAEVLPLHSLLAHPNFTFHFEACHIVLIEAYFLTNRFETAEYLVKLCQTKQKLLAFNLCGDYIFKVVPEAITHLVNNAEVIFGNKAEYIALRALLNYNSLEEMALELMKKEGRILVMTDGPRPVECYSKDEILKFAPPVISESDIIDTTAAGDAFIGGFLAGMAVSEDVKECINIGFYAASSIIKQAGCSLPEFQSELFGHLI